MSEFRTVQTVEINETAKTITINVRHTGTGDYAAYFGAPNTVEGRALAFGLQHAWQREFVAWSQKDRVQR